MRKLNTLLYLIRELEKKELIKRCKGVFWNFKVLCLRYDQQNEFVSKLLVVVRTCSKCYRVYTDNTEVCFRNCKSALEYIEDFLTEYFAEVELKDSLTRQELNAYYKDGKNAVVNSRKRSE